LPEFGSLNSRIGSEKFRTAGFAGRAADSFSISTP